MKKILLMLMLGTSINVFADTEIVNGIEWSYTVVGSEACVKGTVTTAAISTWIEDSISVPSTLGGHPVTSIGDQAFLMCEITGVTIPEGVRSIGDAAFYDCWKLTSVTLPNSVKSIGQSAFYGCRFANITIPDGAESIGGSAFYSCINLESVQIPGSVAKIGDTVFQLCSALREIRVSPDNAYYASVENVLFSKNMGQLIRVPPQKSGDYIIPEGVTNICQYAFSRCAEITSIRIPKSVIVISTMAFSGCSKMASVTFEGDAPATGDGIFGGVPAEMSVHAGKRSTGWTQWNGRMIQFDAEESGTSSENVNLTVTNVVIHYIVNGIQPEKVIPANFDTGFVNIITEVKSGGAVSVPVTWMMNYPNYVTKFGSDFTKSLMKTTGKKDGANNPMLVWQDYVAGTDPTDENDVFTASITTDANGKLIISYNPELSDEEKAKRIYKTLGKVKLTDTDWVEVPTGHEADYNFFKVTVEMK